MKSITVEAIQDRLLDIKSFMKEQTKTIAAFEAKKIMLDVELAVEKIFTAIASDACKGRSGTVTVCLEFQRHKRQVLIVLLNRGQPFNPLTCRQPDSEMNAASGEQERLDACLSVKSVDRLNYEYRAGKNVLVMCKGW